MAKLYFPHGPMGSAKTLNSPRSGRTAAPDRSGHGPQGLAHWQGSSCPGNNAPERISLSDDTVYNFIAVDPSLIGCSGNNPNSSACQRTLTVGIRGDSAGPAVPITVN